MSRRKAKESDEASTPDDGATKTADTTSTDQPADTSAEKPAAKPAKPQKPAKEPRKKDGGGATAAGAVAAARTRVAQVVWLFFVVCALLLAVGALLVALDANTQNSLVRLVLDGADAVDLGVFSRRNGIKEFTGDGAGVKNALLNWGLGAVAYLVVGRILDRLIRP